MKLQHWQSRSSVRKFDASFPANAAVYRVARNYARVHCWLATYSAWRNVVLYCDTVLTTFFVVLLCLPLENNFLDEGVSMNISWRQTHRGKTWFTVMVTDAHYFLRTDLLVFQVIACHYSYFLFCILNISVNSRGQNWISLNKRSNLYTFYHSWKLYYFTISDCRLVKATDGT